MMHSHDGAVVAASGAEDFTEAAPMFGVARLALPVEDTELRDAAMDIVQSPAVL
jgi:hypothetical protein